MRFVYVIILLCLLVACNKQEVDIKQQNISLIYMVADNDLASFAVNNINEMERGFIPNETDKVLIYIDASPVLGLPKNPVLLELQHDTTEQIKSKILIPYPEQNSTDNKVFSTILHDAFGYYTDSENKPKGLVLWSHGSAWLPKGYNISISNEKSNYANDYNLYFKYFGKDNYPTESVMEINDLAEVLSPYHFDYIIFDACFMASIEVLYELRNCTDFVIASPSEILSDGFPYRSIIPKMTKPEVDLKGICIDFYEHYMSKDGLFKSGAITLLNTNYLDDFASFCKSELNIAETWKISKTTKLQQYTRNNENLIFDLKQLLNSANKNYTNWSKLVVYENHTPNMAQLSLKNCSGISSYVLGNKNKLNEYYKNLSWYRHSGFSPVFIDN